jgi:hypothetical protein
MTKSGTWVPGCKTENHRFPSGPSVYFPRNTGPTGVGFSLNTFMRWLDRDAYKSSSIFDVTSSCAWFIWQIWFGPFGELTFPWHMPQTRAFKSEKPCHPRAAHYANVPFTSRIRTARSDLHIHIMTRMTRRQNCIQIESRLIQLLHVP